jgi:hypothetical protein
MSSKFEKPGSTDLDADGNDADHAYEAQAVSRLMPIAFALFVLLGLVGCGVVLWAILHMPARSAPTGGYRHSCYGCASRVTP